MGIDKNFAPNDQSSIESVIQLLFRQSTITKIRACISFNPSPLTILAVNPLLLTQVASRRVFNIAGIIMILMGICGKLGAVFVAIPKPVLAGPIFIAISLLVGAALSNLKEVDLWSTRSQGVLGIAIMAGTVFPTWLQQHPDTFNTGMRLVN